MGSAGGHLSELWNAPTRRADARKGGNVLMPCPTCGRVTNADKIVDLSGVALSVREAWGVSDGACDACRGRLHRNGIIDRATFIETLGAPAEQVERARAKLAAMGRVVP